MKPKKLSDQEVEKLKKMLLAGKTPMDAAEYFNVAVSSIHNYKRTLRESGVVLPDVRGQRPKGNHANEQNVNFYTNKTPSPKEFVLITLSGVNIYIRNSVKSVVVEEDRVIIEP